MKSKIYISIIILLIFQLSLFAKNNDLKKLLKSYNKYKPSERYDITINEMLKIYKKYKPSDRKEIFSPTFIQEGVLIYNIKIFQHKILQDIPKENYPIRMRQVLTKTLSHATESNIISKLSELVLDTNIPIEITNAAIEVFEKKCSKNNISNLITLLKEKRKKIRMRWLVNAIFKISDDTQILKLTELFEDKYFQDTLLRAARQYDKDIVISIILKLIDNNKVKLENVVNHLSEIGDERVINYILFKSQYPYHDLVYLQNFTPSEKNRIIINKHLRNLLKKDLKKHSISDLLTSIKLFADTETIELLIDKYRNTSDKRLKVSFAQTLAYFKYNFVFDTLKNDYLQTKPGFKYGKIKYFTSIEDTHICNILYNDYFNSKSTNSLKQTIIPCLASLKDTRVISIINNLINQNWRNFNYISYLTNFSNEQVKTIIVDLLKKQDKHNHEIISRCLAVLGKQNNKTLIPLIKNYLKSPYASVYCSAAGALGELGDTSGYNLVVNILKNEKGFNLIYASKALAKIGNTNTIKELFTAIKNNDHKYLPNSISEMITTIGKLNPNKKELIKLKKYLKSPELQIRKATYEILKGKINGV